MLLLYCWSLNACQVASVSAASFTDQDLDLGEFGGEIAWVEPADTNFVAYYIVYMATSASGSGKVQVGTAAPVGTNTLDVAINEPLGAEHMI